MISFPMFSGLNREIIDSIVNHNSFIQVVPGLNVTEDTSEYTEVKSNSVTKN